MNKQNKVVNEENKLNEYILEVLEYVRNCAESIDEKELKTLANGMANNINGGM